jgi:hypothetical protein
MNIIEPKGLFEGERLAACSESAQLNWPRLYLASNGYARLELSYDSIISNVYRSFRKPPTQDELWGFFEEFATNHLVILYEDEACWWAQFATSEKYLPRYKTARDERSPAPPLELIDKHRAGYIEWKKSKSFKNQRFQKFSENSVISPKISDAVAVEGAVAVQEQQKTVVQLASEIGREKHAQIIEECFSLYCALLSRDPRRYQLTAPRKAAAVRRLQEREKATGSIEQAKADLQTAIRNLAASEFHTSNPYHDWMDHIFKSQDVFEKRLNWTPPVDIGTKSKPANQEWGAFKAEEGLDIHDQTRDGEDLRAQLQ